MYSVSLSNNHLFTDLARNGSYFVSKREITSDMFEDWDGTCSVAFSGEGEPEFPCGTHFNMELIDCRKGKNFWYFAIGRKH